MTLTRPQSGNPAPPQPGQGGLEGHHAHQEGLHDTQLDRYLTLRREYLRERAEIEANQPPVAGVREEDRPMAERLQSLEAEQPDILARLKPKLERREALTEDERHFLAIDLINKGEESAYANLLYKQKTGSDSKQELVKKLPWWKAWLTKTGISAAVATIISVATGGVAIPVAIGASAVGSLARLVVEYVRNNKELKLREKLAGNIGTIITKAQELAALFDQNPTEENRREALAKLFDLEQQASDPQIVREHEQAATETQEDLVKFRRKWKLIETGVVLVFNALGGAAVGAIFPEYSATAVLAHASQEGAQIDLTNDSVWHMVQKTADGVVRWQTGLAEIKAQIAQAMHDYGPNWHENYHLFHADGTPVVIDPNNLDALANEVLYRNFSGQFQGLAEQALASHGQQVLAHVQHEAFTRAAIAYSAIMATSLASDVPNLMRKEGPLGSTDGLFASSRVDQTQAEQPNPDAPQPPLPETGQPSVETTAPVENRPGGIPLQESVWGAPGEPIRDTHYAKLHGQLEQLNQPFLWLESFAKDSRNGLPPDYLRLTRMDQPQIIDWHFDPADKAAAVVVIRDAKNHGGSQIEIPFTVLFPFLRAFYQIQPTQIWADRLHGQNHMVSIVARQGEQVSYRLIDSKGQFEGPIEKASTADFIDKHELFWIPQGAEQFVATPEVNRVAQVQPTIVEAATIIDHETKKGDATVDQLREADTTRLEPLTTDQKKKIFDMAEIHGGLYQGARLTKQDLDQAGLEPRYQVQLAGGVTICLSSPYRLGKSGRLGAIAYVSKEGRVVARSYYLSNSHVVWRYLPYFTTNDKGKLDWYGKGISQESITVPTGIFAALARLSADQSAIMTIPDADKIFAGPARPLSDKRAGGTLLATTEPVPVMLQGQFYGTPEQRGKHEKHAPESLVFDNSQDEPDFLKTVETFTQQSAISEEVTIDVIPSKDGNLQYLFCRDSENYVWIGQIENLSAIQSTGLRQQWVDGGDLVTTRWQYRKEAGGFGSQRHPTHSHYVDMFPKYLSKMPVIKDYYKKRNITPPVGFEGMI